MLLLFIYHLVDVAPSRHLADVAYARTSRRYGFRSINPKIFSTQEVKPCHSDMRLGLLSVVLSLGGALVGAIPFPHLTMAYLQS